jgi:hypothetical protein
MMFVTRKHLSRRTFLRGAGVTLALPLLESMVPAQTPLRQTAAVPKSRLGCIYVPHGAVMDKWTPATVGSGFEFTEILKPLEPYRDHLCVISNTAHALAGGVGSDAGADHARSAAAYLSGAHPARGVEPRVGITLDQVAAQAVGQETPLPSIELSIEEVGVSCGSGYPCAYTNSISWKAATAPNPMENNPQVVFEKLFGDGSNPAERLQRKRKDRSILDAITEKVSRLEKDLPTSDRVRIDEYLADIREIERRIQKTESQVSAELQIPNAPVGIPESFDEHAKMMFDLKVLAYKADITRISTMMYARDLSPATYPLSGIRDGFHTCSHHSNNRANMDNFSKINRYHAETLAYFLGKLKATPDGDGSLLDHSMILYGSSMADGNQHDHHPLPVLVAGGAFGNLKGGRHIRTADRTPMSNVLLTILNKLGIQRESFGDSNGTIAI